ncbi:hypothetical protein QTG54_011597 [Skeletonema marinoi]|uniref:Uncharacterized protein n=1 Tax=Skeletonema marinoi TaxID=267567 RepID=A0AAD8Y2X1_9STRA|nr:hypothetical protein QTG54_011597 [Skeletonema marinoi]
MRQAGNNWRLCIHSVHIFAEHRPAICQDR